MASTHADAIEVAELTKQWAPADPQTHYSAAVLYEKSFLPYYAIRSLDEYARAAALSPSNYLLWLDLGNARARDGDLAGAERSLRIAEELAPNYAVVQWSLGNVLLREGKAEDAFASIQKAAVGNPEYASPGANLAWQVYGGDVDSIRNVLGRSPAIIGALIPLLSVQKRVDEAIVFWDSLPRAGKESEQLRSNGTELIGGLISLKRFRDAARISSDIAGPEDVKPSIGRISNGDFESDIKTQGSTLFEWKIADGTQPRLALSDGQKHGGERSLLVIFGSDGTNDFRQIEQTVALEPGRAYRFDAFYMGDLQTSASVEWEIADATSGKVLASTSKLGQADTWSALSAGFTVPQGSDGVIVRLVKTGCPSGCPISGKVWFDDLVLREE